MSEIADAILTDDLDYIITSFDGKYYLKQE